MSEFYTNVSVYGNSVLVRGFDETGERVQRKKTYEPYLFIKASGAVSPYADIHGETVKRIDFSNIREAKDFIKKYEDIDGMRVYGYDRWPYMFIYDHYKNMQPDTSKINVVYLDIEVASDDGFPEPEKAEKEVTAITIRRRNLTVVIGCGDFTTTDKNVYYLKCNDEAHLLRKFCQAFENMDVDVITGWNTEFFDIPYLVNRIRRVCGEQHVERLSPWKMVREYSAKFGNKTQQAYDLVGISCLDYLAVYKKFQLAPRESYRLDYIAEVELGEKKLDYSEHGNLYSLYKEDYQKFIEYNIRDVDLVLMLDDKLGYFDQLFALTYDAGVNHSDGLASVAMWDTIIHNYLMDKNIVVPTDKPYASNETIEGGYVKEPQVGMHKWVMSFDLNSLYPHLIMQYNISPDTHVHRKPDECYFANVNVENLLDKKINTEALQFTNMTMTPNGQLYRRDKRGFLPELMKKMYDGRVEYKRRMIEAKQKNEQSPSPELQREITRCYNMQMAMKILLNSAYGAIANKYFRWFENANAEAITMSGQLSIRWIERAINQYMNKLLGTDKDYVIAVDTDSVYINFGPLVEKVNPQNPVDFLDKVASEKFEPFINKSYLELKEYMNAYEQKMIMKRENIGDKAIWTAKKRYIMNVWDSEGVRYKEPQLKMMGIEAIRSSTPSVCRKYIADTLRLIMDTDEQTVQKYIQNVRDEFYTLSFEDIAFPRGINLTTRKPGPNGGTYVESYDDPVTIYKKATPIQVKGALLYNHWLNKYNLNKMYEEIKDGEKIKFCYLKLPNPIRDKVISCPSVLPKEFGLEQYIDYETQFVKGYLDPIITILNVVGWTHEKRHTIEDFFS